MSTSAPTIAITNPTSQSSSRRTSLESTNRSSTISSPALGPVVASTSATQLAASRRNRAALRDFYGLKDKPANIGSGSQAESVATSQDDHESGEGESPLDAPNFNAEQYISSLLQNQSLESILKTESKLLSEIRSLSGDRKALVYDNYSKLITATETIRKMRDNMDPLAPVTKTLEPAVSHIASIAAGRVSHPESPVVKKGNEIRSVGWVVDAPRRLRAWKEGGKQDRADGDWQRVEKVLQAWESRNVDGAKEVRMACEDVMK